MTTKQRLLKYIAYHGRNVYEFEQECGLANAYVRNIRSTITPDKLKKILSRYPLLNVEWLMTGRGRMEHRTVPETLPFDPVPLLDEYARLLETSLYLGTTIRTDVATLVASVSHAIDELSETGEETGYLELLYKRAVRLQNFTLKR